jgi:hypothetical protein
MLFRPRTLFKRSSLARTLLATAGTLSFLSALAATSLFEQHSEPEETHHYNEFWRQERFEDFQSWTRNGVALHGVGSNVSLLLVAHQQATCDDSTLVAGGKVRYDTQAGLCQGQDPYEPRSYKQGINYYNGGSFYFGTLTSPVHSPQQPITTLIPSWNASTPPGTWLEFQARLLQGDEWSTWYSLGIWAGKESAITRHSVDQQDNARARVSTDTLQVCSQPAKAYQLRISLFSSSAGLSPVLWRVYALASTDAKHAAEPLLSSDEEAWGTDLMVPQYSQMLPAFEKQTSYGKGDGWCSPTSVCMLLGYWSEVLQRPDLRQRIPDVAARVYDATYGGTGNWPFNTAYAAEFDLHAYVTRMYSFIQVEKWIQAGVPLAISIAYEENELPGAPIPRTPDGHLLVVRGFTANGDVITNDPAASSDKQVQIVYNRYDLTQAWLNGSHGLVYIIYPSNWPIPDSHQHRCW